jgi:hypothetical protein
MLWGTGVAAETNPVPLDPLPVHFGESGVNNNDGKANRF